MAEPADGPVRRSAPAKINLYLHVVGRRDDGYHLLDSLVTFAGVADTVEVRPAAKLVLRLAGPYARRIPAGPDNLVLRAARTLAASTGTSAGAEITLTKRLPPSSGIGGGSADAAATLRALAELWRVEVDDGRALALALSVGADVPVCLQGRSAYMGGIGEVLTPVPELPPAWFVLVNPGVPVPTAGVFKARKGDFSPPAPPLELPADAAGMAAALRARRNDLEEAACGMAPRVGEALAELARQDDVLLARMSGSGGTCFGLFRDAAGAGMAAARISSAHGKWWVAVAPLIDEVAALDD